MIHQIITAVRNELTKSFLEVNGWFDKDRYLLEHPPQNGGWTIKEILEHISLTNHYLLILIRKGTNKAVSRAKTMDYTQLLLEYRLDWNKLQAIGQPGLIEWNRPDHMEPTGSVSLDEIKTKLDIQLTQCLGYLDQLSNGEGVLHKTMMSVNNFGKIDVYHYICFLAWHAKRHVIQMEKIKNEFENK